MRVPNPTEKNFFAKNGIGVVAAFLLAGILFTGCKNSVQAGSNGSHPAQAAAAPAPPPPMNLDAGTKLAIRLNQHISVKSSQAGDQFTGTIAEPVLLNNDPNTVAIPVGANVTGVVDVSHRRGHFKGRSELALRLTTLQMNGQTYNLQTADNVHEKSGKGKRSAGIISGTTGAGMLIGGVATGGVGLLVGGLVGAGSGTGVAGLTGNRDINLPAETVVHFTLKDPLTIQQQ